MVFDSSKPAGTPKSRFAYLFPSRDAALVSVRMKAGLSEAQRNRTIELIREAVRMPQWQLTHGESYLVTGEPVIVSDLTSSISHSIELLLIAVLLVMAATLGLVFSGRPRLLPLALALLAAALTFGALSVVGASLTMASIAVLPVLVGLAVDYCDPVPGARAGGGSSAARRRRLGPARGRIGAVAARRPPVRPTIATAGAASAAAMLVLLLSPVPMVRGFGVLLVVGVAIALVCALTVGAAAISLVAAAAAAGAPARARSRPSAEPRRWRRVARRARAAGGQPADASGHTRGAGRRCAPPAAGAGRRACAGGARLGPGHADEGADGHHQARAAEPRLAAEPEHARARSPAWAAKST